MKNALKFYYNLNPIDIHQVNKMYKFSIDNYYYTLIEANTNVDFAYSLNIYLNKRGINTIQIILNNQNNISTYINQSSYVLLKSNTNLDRQVNIDDIIFFNNITKNIEYKNNGWYNLWINKIDYFEYQINELENKYPLIKDSFNYFLGLTETAISLLINMNIKPTLCICHRRIKKSTTLFDLYNPFNFIIDSNVRDIAEYIKSIALDCSYSKIEEIIKNLDNDELRLFFIRLLYPSYYFDMYESIIDNQIEEKEINKIINNIDKYEQLIKKTYILLKNICFLPEIDWLIK